MIKVNHKIAVIGDDSVIEDQSADATPVTEGAPLKDRSTLR
jgi:hypothetical protein